MYLVFIKSDFIRDAQAMTKGDISHVNYNNDDIDEQIDRLYEDCNAPMLVLRQPTKEKTKQAISTHYPSADLNAFEIFDTETCTYITAHELYKNTAEHDDSQNINDTTDKTYTPSIGDTVLLEPFGNLRYTKKRQLHEYTIVKIGRQYVYAAPSMSSPNHMWVKIDRKTKTASTSHENAGYNVWQSQQEFDDDCKYFEQLGDLRRYFSSIPCSSRFKNPSKEDLNKIWNILSESGYLKKQPLD